MKKTLLFSILFLGVFVVNAQLDIKPGMKQVNAGVGASTIGIPIYLGADYCILPDVTVGAETSFRIYSDNWGMAKYNHSIIAFVANGNYHFNTLLNLPDIWDVYAGVNSGFYLWTSDASYFGSNGTGLGVGSQVGGRYILNDQFSLNAETMFSTAASAFKFGITYKLP